MNRIGRGLRGALVLVWLLAMGCAAGPPGAREALDGGAGDDASTAVASEALVVGGPAFTGDLAITRWDGERYDVFGISGGRVQHGWANRSAVVEGWETLPPAPSWISFRGRPAAVAWAHGRLDVVAATIDGKLWHIWYEGGWGWWTEIGSGFVGNPTIASWGAQRLDIFIRRASDGVLMHRYYDRVWGGWWELGGAALLDDPAAVSWGPNRLDIFGVDRFGQRLVHRTFDPVYGGWTGWRYYAASEPLGALTLAGPVSVASRGSGRLSVYAQAGERLVFSVYSPDIPWSAWATVAGVRVPTVASGYRPHPGAVSRGDRDQLVMRLLSGGLDWWVNTSAGCGGANEACCSNWWCGSGAECLIGNDEYGRRQCGACGAPGASCCGEGWGSCDQRTGVDTSCELAAGGRYLCTACGDPGQPCCGASCHSPFDYYCQGGLEGGRCVPIRGGGAPPAACGAAGLPCCAGMTCTGSLVCAPEAGAPGRCIQCGALGATCSASTPCCSDLECRAGHCEAPNGSSSSGGAP